MVSRRLKRVGFVLGRHRLCDLLRHKGCFCSLLYWVAVSFVCQPVVLTRHQSLAYKAGGAASMGEGEKVEVDDQEVGGPQSPGGGA